MREALQKEIDAVRVEASAERQRLKGAQDAVETERARLQAQAQSNRDEFEV